MIGDSSEIQYRSPTGDDEADILLLFRACFGNSRDVAQWRWEYAEGPTPVVVVATDQEKVISHYAILPRKFRVSEGVVQTGLVVDVMTHPSYGRRGLFVQSALKAFSDAKVAGMHMLLGFPNEAAIRGHRKVGWIELGKLRVYVLPLRITELLDGVTVGRRVLRPFLVASEQIYQCAFEIITRQKSSEYEVMRVSTDEFLNANLSYEALVRGTEFASKASNARDREWMRWRLSEPSSSCEILVIRERGRAEILGYAILKYKGLKGIRSCTLLDFMVDRGNRRVGRELGNALLQAARSSGSSVCICLGSPSSKGMSAGARVLMVPTQRKLRVIARSLTADAIPPELRSIDAWHIEAIDHDVF